MHSAGRYEDSDEQRTPAYGVAPIVKYIPRDAVVWCPFDKDDSEYVRLIRANGNKVISSHIDDGEDFLSWEPESHWDVIVSNPPFRRKRLFFERALSFGKPFALLMTLSCLNDKYPAWSFYERKRNLQLLKFDKRIVFANPDGVVKRRVTFQSGYLCCDLLPRDIILEELHTNQTLKADK